MIFYTYVLNNKNRQEPKGKLCFMDKAHYIHIYQIIFNHCKRCLHLIVYLYLSESFIYAKNLELLSNNKSNYSIVIEQSAKKTVVVAAEELQNYILKASNIKIPIKLFVESGDNSSSIFLGNGPWIKNLTRNNLEILEEEAFIILSSEKNIYIWGNDTNGDPFDIHWKTAPLTPTLFGVYHFLEQYFNIHWLWSGEIGEEVPFSNNISIPENTKQYLKPKLRHRHLIGNSKNIEWRKYYKRLGFGSSLKLYSKHNFHEILPESKYLDSNPEYFALSQGIRGTRYGNPENAHQVCTTEQGVVNIFSKTADDFFKENPTADGFPISANDGAGFCECFNCTKLDIEKPYQNRPVLTHRLFSFYNTIAKNIIKLYPNKFLTAFAYHDANKANLDLKIEPNLMVYDVYNRLNLHFWQPITHSYIYENMAIWRTLTPNNILLSYWTEPMVGGLNMPSASFQGIYEIMNLNQMLGSKGSIMAIDGSFASAGHDVYLYSKLSWDARKNPDEILDTYYSSLFGENAGKYVMQYHKEIEKIWKEEGAKSKYNVSIKYGNALNLFKEKQDKLKGLLMQAQSRVSTNKEKERLSYITKHWEYIEQSIKAFNLSNNITSSTPSKESLDKEKLKELINEIETRNIMVKFASNENNYVLESKKILEIDKGACTIFATSQFKDLLAGKSSTGTIYRIKNETPSNLDWSNANPLTPFVTDCTREIVNQNVTAKILYNAEKLFIETISSENISENFKRDKVTLRDGPVWKEHAIEIFIDPNNNGERVYHIAINTLGTQFDQAFGKNGIANWNGDWSIATEKNSGYWKTIFTIPFKNFDPKEVPATNTKWHINIARMRPEAGFSVWSPTFGNFHSANFFGEVIFE